MFGMSMTEILVILAIVLVVLGPEKIPEAARTVGKVLREIRKASNLLRDAVNVDDIVKPQKSLKRTVDDWEDAVTLIPDPDPKRDVKVVEMTGRERPNGSLSEVVLTLATPELPHREVYLHIPYEETI